MGCATPSNLLLAGPEHKQSEVNVFFCSLGIHLNCLSSQFSQGNTLNSHIPSFLSCYPKALATKDQDTVWQSSNNTADTNTVITLRLPNLLFGFTCYAWPTRKLEATKKQLAKTAKKHLCLGFMHNSKTPSQLKQIGQCFHPLQRVNKP